MDNVKITVFCFSCCGYMAMGKNSTGIIGQSVSFAQLQFATVDLIKFPVLILSFDTSVLCCCVDLSLR